MRRQIDLSGRLSRALPPRCLSLLCVFLLCLTSGSADAQRRRGNRAPKAEDAAKADTPESAEKPTVAVLEVTGAPRVQAALVVALRKQYKVLSLVKWNEAAQRLSATGRAADEIAMVASDIKVAAVLTGTVKKDKESGIWTLTVTARYGATGKAAGEKLKYPLRSPRVDTVTLKKLLADIEPAMEKAVAGPPPEPKVEETPKEVAQIVPPGREDENPLEQQRLREEEEKRKKSRQRPVWYPYVDAGVGFILGARHFSFNEEPGNSTVKCYDFTQPAVDPTDVTGQKIIYKYTQALKKCPSFATSLAPGLRLDVTAYPLAWLSIGPLRGLGIGGTFDIMFWPSSKVCNKTADDGSCAQLGSELQTSEFRAEVGLRWAWNILNRRGRPSLLASLQYGIHQFAIQKEARTYSFQDKTGTAQTAQGLDDHGLPDIRYQYIDLGLGGRIPYYSNDKWYIGLVLDFHYHIMLDYGEIQSQFLQSDTLANLYNGGGYGPVSGGYGLRVGLTPVEWIPWKGVTVRLEGYFETFQMNFQLLDPNQGGDVNIPPQNRPPAVGARHLAQGAADYYGGGILQVGYQY